MSLVVTGVLVIAISVVLSLVGLVAVRRSIELSTLQDHHDVAGFFIGVLGVVYAVLLAFVVIVVWEDYVDASRTSDAEANQLVDLYWLAEGFDDAERDRIQAAAREYGQVVIEYEWNAMADGRPDGRAEASLRGLRSFYTELEPDAGREQEIYRESLRRLSELNDNRAERLHAASTGLQGLMWTVLIVGGVLTVVFTYFFGVSNIRPQALMTAGLTTMLALTLFLVWNLNHPFRGDFHVDATSFEDAIEEMSPTP